MSLIASSAGAGTNEFDRYPFCAGRMRRETALLLGAKCAEDGLAGLELREEFSRSVEWRAALERGDFIPTFEMVAQLDGVLRVAGHELSYSELAVEIESFPFGAKARELRETYGVALEIEPVTSNPVEIGSGLSPSAGSVRGRDRLLVTSPLVLAAVLLTTQIALLIRGQGYITDITWPAIVGPPALLGFVVVASLPLAERALAWLCRHSRLPVATERLRRIGDDREGAGLVVSHPNCWYQEGEGIHLVSSVRDCAHRCALTADWFERGAVGFGLNMVVASLFFAFSAWKSESGLAILFVVGVFALFAITWYHGRRAHRSQSRLETLIGQGLGINY